MAETNLQLERKLYNEAASHYLSDQEEGDLYDAYKRLTQAQELGDGEQYATDYANIWQPLEHMSVDYIVEVIDNAYENLSDTIPAFLIKMDWTLLKEQKNDVLMAISTLYRDAKEADSVGEDAQADETRKLATSLEGIIGLLDATQDYVVDKLGMDEKEVFNLSEE